MGYRSEVKVITTKEGWEKLDRAVRKASGITPENENDKFWLTDKTHFTNDGNYIIGEWDDYKWYQESFEDVAAFMETLIKLTDDHIPYEFLRIGEDWEDADFLHNWDDYPDDMPRLEYVRAAQVVYYNL